MPDSNDNNPGGIGGFFKGLMDNFGSKEGGPKWGAILGTALFAIVGYMFGGLGGGVLGLFGGGAMSSAFNQLTDYVTQNVMGNYMGDTNLAKKAGDVAKQQEIEYKDTKGVVRKASITVATPENAAQANPEDVGNFISSFETIRSAEQSGNKAEAVKAGKQLAFYKDHMLQAHTDMLAYDAQAKAYMAENGPRAKSVDALYESLLANSGDAPLSGDDKTRLRGYAEKAVPAMPVLKEIDAAPALGSLTLADPAKSRVADQLTYRTQDLEALAKTAYQSLREKESGMTQAKIDEGFAALPNELKMLVLADAEQKSLLASDKGKTINWELIAEKSGGRFIDRYRNNGWLFPSTSGETVVERAKLDDPDELAKWAFAQSRESYGKDEKAVQNEFLKVVEFANQKKRYQAAAQYLNEHMTPRLAAYAEFAKDQQAYASKVKNFTQQQVPVFNDTGLLIVDKRSVDANHSPNGKTSDAYAVFDSKHPALTIKEMLVSGERVTHTFDTGTPLDASQMPTNALAGMYSRNFTGALTALNDGGVKIEDGMLNSGTGFRKLFQNVAQATTQGMVPKSPLAALTEGIAPIPGVSTDGKEVSAPTPVTLTTRIDTKAPASKNVMLGADGMPIKTAPDAGPYVA